MTFCLDLSFCIWNYRFRPIFNLKVFIEVQTFDPDGGSMNYLACMENYYCGTFGLESSKQVNLLFILGKAAESKTVKQWSIQ